MEGAIKGKVEVNRDPSFSLLDLLNVDLVNEKLLSYLNLPDMKFLSEVSKGIKTAVRNSNEYSNKTKLVIRFPDVNVENDLDSIKDFSATWKVKNLQILLINGEYSIAAVEQLEELLMKVESVIIYFYGWNLPDYLTFHVVKTVKNILEKTKSLKHLGLEPAILTKWGLQDVISNESVAANLRNLETLKIQPIRGFITAQLFCEDRIKMSKAIDELSLVVGNLKTLVFGKICTGDGPQSDYVEGLLRIINRNRETLEVLEIWDKEFCKLEEIGNIYIPNLKRLVIEAQKSGGASLEQFLARQPQLDYLNVGVKDQFPLGIIRVIEEKQSKLKELLLKAKHFSDRMDWGFLKKLEKLKCFTLQKPYSYSSNDELYGYCEDILKCLPSSVESIGLVDFEVFWRPSTSRTDRNIWQRISHLKCLNELNLFRCKDAINDQGLQDLISNCPDLTLLLFSHCSDVTNYGVTGVDLNGERTGVSLEKLAGLRFLIIRSCPEIGNELLSVVKFRFLKQFAFDGRKSIVKELDSNNETESPKEEKEFSCRLLLSQNPCLEKVSLNRNYGNEEKETDVKKMSRRLTFLTLGLQFISHKADNDSDASSDSEWDSDDDDYDGAASDLSDGFEL